MADKLTLDLSRVVTLEAPSLVFLVARLIERITMRMSTHVVLPSSRRAVRQLQAWQAANVFDDMAGSGLVTFENLEQLRLNTGSGTPPSDTRTTWHRALGLRLLTRSGRSFEDKLASSVSSAWRDDYILSTLNRDLLGYGKRVSTHIVHEAVMNVVRNADATWMAMCSTYDLGTLGGRRFLTISIWDNGTTIAETLRHAADRGDALIPVLPGRHLRKYAVSLQDHHELLSSTDVPDASAPDWRLLLSALYAGITSDPTRPGSALPDVVEQDPTFSLPGMGLFILANTVLDVFDGSISIRSGRHNLSIAPSRTEMGADPLNAKQTDYNVSLVEHPAHAHLNGNLLTVRVPLTQRDPYSRAGL